MKKYLNLCIALLCFSLSACAQSTKETSAEKGPLTGKAKQYYKKTLNPETYTVMVEKGTELPFQNKYWNNHEKGVYVSAATGEPLFSSDTKFESHTGWPSFYEALNSGKLEIVEDRSFGEVRKEVVEKKTGLHLGHVFDDGPQPTGLRYCMNSAALRFVPAKKQ